MRVGLVLSAAIFHLLSSACSDVSALDLGLEGARAEALLGAQVDNKKPVATGTGTGTGRRPKSFEKDCLAAHNKWRKIHQANPLKIDHKLTAFARKRAEFIARSDGAEFRHPSDLEYGENLAWHSRNSSGCAKLVQMWYDELALYSFERPQFSHETGHFSQLVWNNTERVGCASATSGGPRGGIYLVCNYDPPGNYLGEFEENVRPVAAPASASASGSAPNVGRAASPSVVATSTTTTTTTTTTTPKPVTSRPLELSSAKPTQTGASANSSEPPKNRKKSKKSKKKRKNNKKKKPSSTTSKPASNSTTSTTSTSTTATSTITIASNPNNDTKPNDEPKRTQTQTETDKHVDRRKRRRSNSTREQAQRQPMRRRREQHTS